MSEVCEQGVSARLVGQPYRTSYTTKEIDFLESDFEKIRSEVEVHFQIQTGKGGPGSIAPPLMCFLRSTVVRGVQSTEIPAPKGLVFWKKKFGFSGSLAAIFLEARAGVSSCCSELSESFCFARPNRLLTRESPRWSGI